MKIMLRAAIAALSIASIGPALADGGDGTIANTQFTELPGVVAQAQVPNAPAMRRTASRTIRRRPGKPRTGRGCTIRLLTQSSHGTWLFPPNANEGGNS